MSKKNGKSGTFNSYYKKMLTHYDISFLPKHPRRLQTDVYSGLLLYSKPKNSFDSLTEKVCECIDQVSEECLYPVFSPNPFDAAQIRHSSLIVGNSELQKKVLELIKEVEALRQEWFSLATQKNISEAKKEFLKRGYRLLDKTLIPFYFELEEYKSRSIQKLSLDDLKPSYIR